MESLKPQEVECDFLIQAFGTWEAAYGIELQGSNFSVDACQQVSWQGTLTYTLEISV